MVSAAQLHDGSDLFSADRRLKRVQRFAGRSSASETKERFFARVSVDSVQPVRVHGFHSVIGSLQRRYSISSALTLRLKYWFTDAERAPIICYMDTAATQPPKHVAVYRWWKTASEADRGAVAVEAGYGTGLATFAAESLNKFESDAFARVLSKRGLITFAAERTSYFA